ncbi:hypothetical protein ACOZ4I_08965 [Haloarcula salina]|uniref:hypothetical protein n=1 Tax=Haloarcula salina TaxID=1429914 RepID=UPI003C6FD122
MAAAEWSHLVNFIPNPSGIYDAEQQKKMFDNTAFTQDGASIASIYKNVLQFSEVASAEPTEEQKAQVKRARELLTEVRTEPDLLTGEPQEITDDSRLVKAYDTFRSEYENAVIEYNGKKLASLNAQDALAVQDWMLNGEMYRNKVRRAHDKWVTAGHKHDVEKLWALVDQVTQRSLKLLKADLEDDLEKAEMSNPGAGGETFYWTSLIPSSLPFSEGWSTYDFKQSDTKIHEDKQTNEWEGDAKIPVFGWGFSPKASGKQERYEREVDTTDFTISFEIAQGMISRPWMSTNFLLSNAWRFGPNMPNLTNLTETLSNGEKPPEFSGSMVAFPTTAIFVRNVLVDFAELHEEESQFKRDIDAGLDLSIGPVRLGGGKYKRGDEERTMEKHTTDQGLKIPGMQLIGFKCKLLPKLPNPSPEVPEEQWT